MLYNRGTNEVLTEVSLAVAIHDFFFGNKKQEWPRIWAFFLILGNKFTVKSTYYIALRAVTRWLLISGSLVRAQQTEPSQTLV